MNDPAFVIDYIVKNQYTPPINLLHTDTASHQQFSEMFPGIYSYRYTKAYKDLDWFPGNG